MDVEPGPDKGDARRGSRRGVRLAGLSVVLVLLTLVAQVALPRVMAASARPGNASANDLANAPTPTSAPTPNSASSPTTTPSPTRTPSPTSTAVRTPSASRPTFTNAADAVPYTGKLWPLPKACRTAGERRIHGTVTEGRVRGAAQLGDYYVSDDQLLPKSMNKIHPCDARLWAVIQAVYPPEQRALVKELTIYDGTRKGKNLTTTEYTGVVAAFGGTGQDWTLSLDPNVGKDSELARILVHELAHLVTLNSTQVDPKATTCPSLELPDGCPRPGSLYRDYVSQTWNPKTLRQWQAKAGSNDELTKKQKAAFSRAHYDEFISDYAATNPREDFAVTFAAWCLGEPVGTYSKQLSIKANFMKHRPELQQYPVLCKKLRG